MFIPKVSPFLILIFLAILPHLNLEVLANANAVHPENSKPPLGFIDNLQGCHKGQTVQGLNELKTYLTTFGYLTPDQHSDSRQVNNNSSNNDYFDEATETAIKKYQNFFNLNVSGILDAATVSQMRQPRCGVSDINIFHGMSSGNVIKPDYNLYPGNPKWPKSTLTYAFRPGKVSRAGQFAIRKSLSKWKGVTNFNFVYTNDYANADIKFSFEKGRHDGDNSPFDGPGGVVAHSARPTGGMVHFDSTENWTLRPKDFRNAIGLLPVSLHEIGHALGLDHSQDPSAIMWPAIPYGTDKELGADDIRGIRTLYNLPPLNN